MGDFLLQNLKFYGILLLVFIFGGVYYGCLETLWRGYTHWTMLVTGGACVLCLFLIGVFGEGKPLWQLCVSGCLFITAIELCSGWIVNLQLGLAVWDYSEKPLHYLGQISLTSSLFWLLLSFPGILLCRIVARLAGIERQSKG